MVVLDLDQHMFVAENKSDLRLCYHVSLEQHFIQLSFGVDEVLLRLW